MNRQTYHIRKLNEANRADWRDMGTYCGDEPTSFDGAWNSRADAYRINAGLDIMVPCDACLAARQIAEQQRWVRYERVTDLRAQAARLEERAAASFERVDTDGFLTQAASQAMANLRRAEAQIVEDGGALLPALYDGDRRIDAKMTDGKFGTCWRLSDAEAETYGRRFIPLGRNSRVQKLLGLHQRQELQPAKATMTDAWTVRIVPAHWRV